ncbi:hypothetical protein SAMN05421788_11746 [Filimonas lacunae]|uniref:DUF985 domain-containing protein n=1 Tax=Filimonas lacunae TaxID=477680 RepID=A0A173MEG9_9BACT|nr:cupin domain-containing protein [Filimonas lacunae]BAV05879.1 hypothetical protein of cupin superfamily [Filimonas lacunae]SIT34575.1 hypothetical protein SAMN05421788_11746 [Filimonas lacunae]
MATVKEIIEWYNMQPNDAEGGYYAEVHTSDISLPDNVLPGFPPLKGGRSLYSAIYYMLPSGETSVLHRVTGDMLYHFYSGLPVEMLLLYPPGSKKEYELCVFGNILERGSHPMKMIPGGTWMGSRLLTSHVEDYAFMGVSLMPGFNPADYTIGKREELIKEYPNQADLIKKFTRDSY